MIETTPRWISGEEYLNMDTTKKAALICYCTCFNNKGSFGHIVDKNPYTIYKCTKCGLEMRVGIGNRYYK